MTAKEYISKQRKPLLSALGYAGVLLIGFLDYVTGTAISFSIFYLIPIFVVTWFVGIWAGILTAVASAVT